MSFLVGPISGALVAGGVCYGFTNLVRTRTEQHIKDLHALSVRLVDTPTLVQAPPSAATRIRQHSLATDIKSQWNDEIANLFTGIQNLDRTAVKWGKSLLYGPPVEEKAAKPSPSSSS